ncbi:MAG: hypothetical protein AABW68_01785 [archaeon]
MKIPFCSPAHAKRYISYVHSRYGIPLSLIKAHRWIQHNESVWMVHALAQPLADAGANIFSLGLLAFSNGSSFEPTSHFITGWGKHIAMNIVTLDPLHVDSFFQRKKIGREFLDVSRVLSDGWVAVSFEGVVVGSGLLTRNHLITNLPPTLHAKENE